MKKFFLMLAAIASLYAFSANDASAQRIIIGGGGERILGGGGGGVLACIWVGASTVCTAGTLIVTVMIVGNTQGRELSQEREPPQRSSPASSHCHSARLQQRMARKQQPAPGDDTPRQARCRSASPSQRILRRHRSAH